jgi:hypothetical protein
MNPERGEDRMVVTQEKIHQMELALAEARAEYERENGKRYEIIMREISEDERQRILDSLTDRKERVLFGLEAPSSGAERPGKSGGNLSCPICGKTGLTTRGLALHKVRKHKGEREEMGEPQAEAGMFETETARHGRRRG